MQDHFSISFTIYDLSTQFCIYYYSIHYVHSMFYRSAIGVICGSRVFGFGTTAHSSLLCVCWFRVGFHLERASQFFAIRYTYCWIEF